MAHPSQTAKAVAPLLATAGHSQSYASSNKCGTWQVVPSPNVGTSNNNLYAVSAVAPNDVWAVGYTVNFYYQTLIEHWNGTAWSIVPSPNLGSEDSILEAVTALSANDVWAVGYSTYNGNTQSLTLIEHWDGTNWSIISSPSPGSINVYLAGVAASSSTDIWAVGTFNFANRPQHTLVEHWDGTQWSVVQSPSPRLGSDTLNAVTVVSPTNVWAVGYINSQSGIGSTLIEHWNGTQWRVVTSPNPGISTNVLTGVTQIPGTRQLWSVGYDYTSQGQTLISQWKNRVWTTISSQNPGTSNNILSSVTANSANNAWTVGTYVTGQSSNQFTLIEHWDGTSWSVVSSPNPGAQFNWLMGVTRVPGTKQIWAVGFSNDPGSPYRTLIESNC